MIKMEVLLLAHNCFTKWYKAGGIGLTWYQMGNGEDNNNVSLFRQ